MSRNDPFAYLRLGAGGVNNDGLADSRLRGDQAYQTVTSDYDAIAADALATRERNMARVDQYGASARQDLDIRNRQEMARAGQSAIQRGLGNTTVYDSLQRGQQFDNTRQHLALEDQLLQNRISTDSSLSGAYQNVLGNRAQARQSQFNTNTGNYDNMYMQWQQMQNANRQAELDRSMNPQAGALFAAGGIYGPSQRIGRGYSGTWL